jgi:hypothetical protein
VLDEAQPLYPLLRIDPKLAHTDGSGLARAVRVHGNPGSHRGDRRSAVRDEVSKGEFKREDLVYDHELHCSLAQLPARSRKHRTNDA